MAVKDRSTLQTTINTNLPDNSTLEISPADTRGTQTDLNDSAFNKLSDDTDDLIEGLNKFVDSAEKSKISNTPSDTNAEITNLQNQIDALEGSVVIVGNWDAASGTFPDGSTNTTPAISPINKGYKWISTSDGTIDGVSFNTNDQITALVDSPSASVFSGNWIKQDFTDNVISVNGEVGTVVLDADDIDETASRKWINVITQSITGLKTFVNTITGSAGIIAHRISTNQTTSFIVDSTYINKMATLDILGAFTITVNDSSGFAVDDELEIVWVSGAFSVSVVPGGLQTIISDGGKLNLSDVGSGAILKYLGSDRWVLIGSLSL